jgi:hypothetical protein
MNLAVVRGSIPLHSAVSGVSFAFRLQAADGLLSLFLFLNEPR